ncbi:fluoride efflux transporter FluC [Weissella kandleri]|uniref:fluoride efflux transporter FluC n=1 Tax=Weissella kandleri TaxID=1616 RepID=UPI00387EB265
MTFLIAGSGAALGSIARYWLLERLPEKFPKLQNWKVVILNLIAIFLMGYVTGLGLNSTWSSFIATGMIGGFSTYSTPIIELANSITADHDQQLGPVLLKSVIMFIGGFPILWLAIYLAGY